MPIITVVVNTLDVGGCERHLSTIIPFLAQSWSIRIILFGPQEGLFAQELRAQGIEIITLLKHPLWQKYWPMRRIASLWVRARQLHGWLKKSDLVHCFLPSPYLLTMVTRLFIPYAQRPGVIMSRRSLNHYQTFMIKKLEHYFHKHILGAIGNSRSVVQQLHEEGLEPSKVHLIYNGIATENFSRPERRSVTRKALGIDDQEVVIIHLANLFAYKGHSDLIAALALIDSSLSFCVLCIGRDDGLGAQLQEQAEALKVSHRIKFLGLHQDVSALLAAGDIGLLCSHQEGFSNAILEKMAAGLPLIVTDVGGNAEAVVHGKTGYIIPPHNPDALARSLQDLITDPQKCRLWGLAGQERAQQMFSLPSCVAQYNELYRHWLCQSVKKNEEAVKQKIVL